MVFLSPFNDIKWRSHPYDLYLAIPQSTYEKGFQRSLAVMTIRRNRVKRVIVDVQNEVIVQWID
jgi:XisH protein